MTIEELENKHSEIIGESDLGVIEELSDSVNYEEEMKLTVDLHTKLSLQFAIEVLEDIIKSYYLDGN